MAEGGGPSDEINISMDDAESIASPSFEQLRKNVNVAPRPRVYPENSTGPWVVYFRPKDKPLNIIRISKDLSTRFSGVTEITKVRPNKLRVVTDTRKQANDIAAYDLFNMEYRVYIPARDVEIDGVVTERSLTREMILKDGMGRFRDRSLPNVTIVDCKQLHSASTVEGKKVYTPSDSFRVTFSGSALPNYVAIGRVLIPVRLFVPRVMNCDNCKQLGHTSAYCGNKKRCGLCGESHPEETCAVDAPKCVYCNEDPHDIKSCPEYKKRTDSLKQSLKDRSKKSFAEILKKTAPVVSENPFILLLDDDSDSDDPCEGTSQPLPGGSRKRKKASSPKLPRKVAASSDSGLKTAPKRSTGAIPKQSSPGFRSSSYNQEFPVLPGTSETPNVPLQQTAQPKTGLFSFSAIVDGILEYFDISEPLKTIVTAMLPAVKSFLEQLTEKWPLLAMIISFDG